MADHVAERSHLSTTTATAVVHGPCVNVITATEGQCVMLRVWSADRSAGHSVLSLRHALIREMLQQPAPSIKLHDSEVLMGARIYSTDSGPQSRGSCPNPDHKRYPY